MEKKQKYVLLAYDMVLSLRVITVMLKRLSVFSLVTSKLGLC